MRLVSEGGTSTQQYFNVGNTITFPTNCAQCIPSLQSSTDCRVELLSVASDLLCEQSIAEEKVTSDVAMQSMQKQGDENECSSLSKTNHGEDTSQTFDVVLDQDHESQATQQTVVDVELEGEEDEG